MRHSVDPSFFRCKNILRAFRSSDPPHLARVRVVNADLLKMHSPHAHQQGFCFSLGTSGTASFDHPPCHWPLDLPWLDGACTEALFSGLHRQSAATDFELLTRPDLLLGRLSVPFSPPSLEADTHRAYARLLAACADRHLYRIWNYVPRINEHTQGLEHYRAFCKGRSLAFESFLGPDYRRQLPAASAVGSDGATLEIIFAAGDTAPRHVENPEQMPAYLYPPDYGPRPPSFSRATRVTLADREWLFISGTAAIKGHASMGQGSLAAQIQCTLDNLRLVSQASGIGDGLGRNQGSGEAGWRRHFKIYLRRADTLDEVRRALIGTLVFSEDQVIWLRSDICRAELDLEIEASLWR